MVFGPLLSNGRQRVGAFKKTRACRKNAFKHSYKVECGNRLRVGVLVLKTLACWGLRVGPSKNKHLLASRDVIISSEICGSVLQRVLHIRRRRLAAHYPVSQETCLFK